MTRKQTVFWAAMAFYAGLSSVANCQAEDGGDAKKTTGLWGSVSSWKLPDTVQIHGFASQSYIHTTGNEFFGHSTNTGSLDFTEMGLNGSWRPLPQLQASMQVVYRRAGRTDNQNVRLDFGFLDYSVISDAENRLGVRGGRVFLPYGFYNDTRDMPFTRPSIFLPQSIYFDVDRNFSLSGDGVQIYGEHRSDIGDFSLQIDGVYPRTNDPELNFQINGGLPGSLTGDLSWMGRLGYDGFDGKLRLAFTSGQYNAHYVPKGAGANLDRGHFEFSPILFSAKYTDEKWSLTGEYAIRPTRLRGFGPLFPIPDGKTTTGESYYVQGEYRIAQDWLGFLRYDVNYANRNDTSGQQTAATLGGPAYYNFAKDITFGLRWDVASWWMLRAEYHIINGAGWTSVLENMGDTEQHWKMFALSTSFRF